MPSGTRGQVEFVTSGTYNSYRATDSSIALTAGTEYEMVRFSNQITAATESADQLYSWAKGTFMIVGPASSPFVLEWFILRQDKDDAIPAMDDGVTVKNLLEEKRILKRGWCFQGGANTVGARKLEIELYNVKLRADEELRLVFYPWTTATIQAIYSVMEWRQVGR